MSLRPSFWNLLQFGEKTVELRRRGPALAAPFRVVVYASAPVSAVVGTFVVTEATESDTETLWASLGGKTGIARPAFEAYFAGATKPMALHISDVEPLSTAVPLAALRTVLGRGWPPQSYRYISAAGVKQLLCTTGDDTPERNPISPANPAQKKPHLVAGAAGT